MEPIFYYQTFQQQMLEYYAKQGKPLPDIYKYSDNYDYRQPLTKKKKESKPRNRTFSFNRSKSKKQDISLDEYQRDSISSTDSENPIYKNNNHIGEDLSLLPRDSL